MAQFAISSSFAVLLVLLVLLFTPPTEAGRKKGKGNCKLTHGMKKAQCSKKALGCGWRWVGTCNNVGGTPGFGGCQKVGNCGAMKCPGTCKALGCTWNSATGSCSATCDAVCAAAQWDGLASPVPPLNGVVSGCTFTNVTSTLIGYAGATSGVVLLPSTGLHSYKFKMGVGFVASPPIPLQPFVSTITGGIVFPPAPPVLTPLAASTGDIFEYVINTTYNAVPPSYGITVYINGALQATGFIPVAGEVDGLRFGISGGPALLPLSFEQVC